MADFTGMNKKKIDKYFSEKYEKLRGVATNILMNNLQSDEYVDTLIVLVYEYIIDNEEKLSEKIENGLLESIVVNWMYKQVIWKGTTFKKDFIYKRDLPLQVGDDEYIFDNQVEDTDDFEDVLRDEYEHQNKMAHIESNREELDYPSVRLYHIIFTLGHDSSGKLSKYTGIPRTTCWVLMNELKEKLRKGYE